MRINLGLLGLAGAFLVGVIVAGLPAKEVLSGFPADIFVTLVGITYLFALARNNGTIDLIVDGAARLLGHRAAAMPLLVFTVSALLTALGALGPAAVAIIAPVALRFARQYGLSPLMMGLVTIHGAQAGAFSPMSVYGGIANQVIARTGVAPDPIFLFLASLIFNALIAACIMLLFGRMRQPAAPNGMMLPTHADLQPVAGVTRDQLVTLAGLTALVATPLLAGLLLCYLAGIVSAFASSTALLGVVIPLAAPLFGSNAMDAIPLAAAIAVSTTIVDTSPFSTNGALVVANAAPEGRAALLRQLLIYSAFIVAVGPFAAWAVFMICLA